MRQFMPLAFLVALAACQSSDLLDTCPDTASEITYAGGDGTTPESAVVIVGACGSSEGVPAEYAWLKVHLPDAKPKSQSLVTGPPSYDVFVVTLPSGAERKVYFDITSFFGKL